METIKQAALRYRERGLSVIPLKGPAYAKGDTEEERYDDAKKSLIVWKAYQKKLATEDEIRGWFEQWPKANVAIVTGEASNQNVIDVDDPDLALPVLSPLLSDSPAFPIVNTPGGGQHYYFQCTDEKLPNNKKVIPGADFRGEGGYVVAPPSVNGSGAYTWDSAFNLDTTPAPALPSAYVLYLNSFKHSFKGDYKGDIRGPAISAPLSFDKGSRDETIFHVANALVRGGMPEREIVQTLARLGSTCIPPFPEKEIQAKILSAIQRHEHRDSNLAEEVERWVSLTNGYFSLTDAYKDLQVITGLTNPYKKNNIHQIFYRLKERGIIEPVGTKNGVYRRIDTTCEDIDFLGASDDEFPIEYPFGIEDLVKTMPGNIIGVAGVPNSGKTAFLLNVVEKNMDEHDVIYFSSEMGKEEMRARLLKFDRPLESWRFTAKSKSSNFADAIRPDSINIIDFLEMHEDFWNVGGLIKQIFDKLKRGIAIIALQKNPGANYGLGGARSIEKARLYLTMDNHVLKIEKGKNWRDTSINPNGMRIKYKLAGGCKFIKTTSWDKE